uniref:Transmembrane protein n=1 Tax=Cacopsylla melanoneura TaxID=428564 RepID=A0A8D8ZG75_9HEMI
MSSFSVKFSINPNSYSLFLSVFLFIFSPPLLFSPLLPFFLLFYSSLSFSFPLIVLLNKTKSQTQRQHVAGEQGRDKEGKENTMKWRMVMKGETEGKRNRRWCGGRGKEGSRRELERAKVNNVVT